ncbi:MAG: histidine kinase [Bacteroidetes bacterium]|nr:histidine kinase [Bacteroidota bacterium]
MRRLFYNFQPAFGIALICLFIVALPIIGINVPRKFSVTYFSSQNGVEDGLVNHIIQDQKGLLWFATWNGLYRFDGYNFKNYKSNTEDRKGLTNDRLLHINEDKYGCIWVLCYDSTTYRFNPSREIFEPIQRGTLNKFQSIQVFPNGIVWLLRKDGSAIRAQTDAKDLALTLQSYSMKEKTIPSGKIHSVFMDSKLHEWILTDNGLYFLHNSQLSTIVSGNSQSGKRAAFYSVAEQNGKLSFGSNYGKFYEYSLARDLLECKQLKTVASIISVLNVKDKTVYITDKDGFFINNSRELSRHFALSSLTELKDKAIESAQITRNGLLWLTHSMPGVTLFDLQTQKLTFIESKDELGRPLNTESGFLAIEDRNGILWIHPKGGGFSYYDPQRKQLVPFNTTDKSIKWKSNDRCFAAFADRQGNLWMSTQLDRLKRITFLPDKFHIYTPDAKDIELPDNEVRALYIDQKNRIWTGTRDQNVSIYDSQLNLIHRFKLGKVYAVMEAKEGSFWISTKGEGLTKASESTPGKFDFKRYRYNANDLFSLSSDNIYYTFQDSKKRIWIATYGGGLNLALNSSSGSLRFINYRNRLKRYPIDRFYKVRHITEDTKGRIWVSTTAGILLFDGTFKRPEDITFHVICRKQGDINSLSNNDVQMVTCTDKGQVLAITYGGGLNELIKTGDYSFKCKSFTQKNGLISDIIYSMQEDRYGNLWLATGGGLVKFIAAQEQIQYPNEHIAFNMHFSEGVGATNGEQIYFGTNRGLFHFTPEKIHKTTFVPRIFFSSVWVDNQELTPKNAPSILTTSLDNISHLTLPSNNHSLRLAFSALDMTNTEYIQYAYMLEGFDTNYRQAGNGREANYTNLPPGNYTFRVKSTNNEGVWGNNERALSIEVLPTFNETLFAQLLYFALAFLFIVGGVYIYTVFYRMKHKARNEEYLTQLKLSFFTNVSHELRTPLTLITGPLEVVLKNENLSEKVKDTLNIIKKNCDRMQRLVGQILDFSKIQDNKMKLRVQRVDIVNFTREITRYFAALAKERHITLTFIAEPTSCYIWLDADNIEKVLFNLLSNAFKYTPDEKCICVNILERTDCIIIQITDQGIGIQKEKQKSIFNRFENLVQENFQAVMSSGIGLSVAKELVEMHHGDIAVESESGKGSTFSVRLLKGKNHYPADTEYILSDLDEPEIEARSEEQATETTAMNMLLMLIVEDNHELRAFIKQIFQDKFRVIEAQDGSEGLEKAFSCLPDIIITDIMMPVKDGIQMLQELRNDERTSHIPAIVLTAKADMDSVLIGIQTGADDYITKPFSVSYLQAKVDNLLAQRKKLQAYYCSNKSIFKNALKEETTLMLSSRDTAFLTKLAEIMEQQISNADLDVDYLVSCFSLSRTNFFHKLKSLTGLAPIMYIREIRMQKAAELIKEKQYSMAEIAYMVGYSDPHYFSKSFKAFWGINSTEYAKQLNE